MIGNFSKMSNIYSIISLISQIKARLPFLNESQQQFVKNILGDEDLKELNKLPSITFISALKQKVQIEFDNYSHLGTSFVKTDYYLSRLKKILDILSVVEKSHTDIKNYTGKFPVSALRLDSIFEETETKFNGKIILPVNQSLDFRLGNIDGACVGFTCKWALEILKSRKPFGINLNKIPAFKPIPLNSPIGKKYPDLNHLIPFSKKIYDLQINQENLPLYILQSENKTFPLIQHIHISEESFPHFHKSNKLAKKLIELSNDKENDTVYELDLNCYTYGHTIGFCKRGNKYYFFDSNSAWYSFNQAKDFQEWFSYYFKKMSYENKYLESSLRVYSTHPLENESKPFVSKSRSKIVNFFKFQVLPHVYIAKLVFYFVTRAFVYGSLYIINRFKKEENLTEPTKSHKEEVTARIADEPMQVSYRKLSAVLDIPLKDILKIKEKVAHNPEFTHYRKSNINQTHSLVEHDTSKFKRRYSVSAMLN